MAQGMPQALGAFMSCLGVTDHTNSSAAMSALSNLERMKA
jgi:hypothetical protein